MTTKQQKGFSAVEALLIIIVIALLGVGGWFLWHRHQTRQPVVATSSSASKPAASDPTASWISYSNTPGKFSLRHPSTWVFAASPDACTSTLVLMGADSASVGHCASEDFGQMVVASTDGDHRAENELKIDGVTKKTVAVAGVSGFREAGTTQETTGGPTETLVRYIFFANGRTYTATYTQKAAYPDALTDFDLMITNTLKLSS